MMPKDEKSQSGIPEEAEGGSLAPNPELEEALREATEAIEKRQAQEERGDKDDSGLSAAEVDALEARIAELETENATVREQGVRLQADFDNHRKRTLKERQDNLQYGHENVVKDLLGTVDNLQRAIEHASQSDGGDLEGLLQGVELVQRELLGTLAKHGVSEIEADGIGFDPNVHEAMAQVEDSETPPGNVLQVLQKGYQLRDRLLRPARVIVAKAAEPETAPETNPEPESEAAPAVDEPETVAEEETGQE